jgi:hypothetical protein
MDDRARIATRKGLFELRRRSAGWAVEKSHFLGEPVSMLLPPDGSGRMLAASTSATSASSCTARRCRRELAGAGRAGLPGAAGRCHRPGLEARQIWSLEERGGTVWAGTIPGGLFRSADRGASWQLVETLWCRPERGEWFGGGYDAPGIHSICPHPGNDRELLLGISCGGVWVTRDDGTSWSLQAVGMRAAYMPPERAYDPDIQDPHSLVQCAAAPHVWWSQHHNGIFRSTDNAASWHEISGAPLSSFGFAVATDPNDADCAWFVPGVADDRRVPVGAALAVNRTATAARASRPCAPACRRPIATTRLPSRPRGRRQRHELADGEHDRQLLGERRRRRELARGQRPPASGLRSALRLARSGRLVERELPGLADQLVAEASCGSLLVST